MARLQVSVRNSCLITRDLRFKLFFGLPLDERAVVVMDTFASAELDGELAFMMHLMLLFRTQPGSALTNDDRVYTASLFRTIESYSEAQVRRFCGYDPARYALFQRNLRHWKARCQLPA